MNAVRACLGCGVLMATAALRLFAGGVVDYPAEGDWSGIKVVNGGGWIWLDRADGSHAGFLGAMPDGNRFTKFLVVSNTQDCLHVDVRAAFAAGADAVTIYTAELPLDLVSDNDAVTARVTWEGPCGMKMRDLLIGDRKDGTGWNEGFEYTSGFLRKRTTEHTFKVPSVKKVYHRVDVLSPGGGDGHPGEFRLYGIRTGNYAELATPRPRYASVKPLFAVSFDRGFTAELAGGNAAPVVTNAVERVPGKKGMGVRFRQDARSTLGYAAKGNVNPIRGTLAFWFRKEWNVSDCWRTLFCCPGAGTRGDGTIDFWFQNDTLRLDRHDLDNWHEYILPSWLPKTGDEWIHYIFTWDEESSKVYVNGRAAPNWADPTQGDDYSVLRAALGDVNIHEFDRKKGSFKNFFLGGKADGSYAQDGVFDEVKLFSGAMSAAEARSLAKAEGVELDEKPFAVKVGPNPYEGAVADKPGELTNLNLLRTVRPAEEKFNRDDFASVGELRRCALTGARSYLEAGSRANDRFAIRFKLDPAKPLYCFEVDYPDDKVRSAEFLVQRTANPGGDYTLQAGVFCGGEYANSGKLRTERYVYWTSESDITFIATTLRANEPAAVSEIRLYEIADAKLPRALKPSTFSHQPSTSHRHFVSYWEDPAFVHDFAADGSTPESLSDMIDRFAAYMKFCGQDTLSFPACFYGGRIGANGYNPRRLAPGYLEAFLKKFDAEGLFIVPNVNQQRVPMNEKLVTREAMLDGSLHSTEIAILSNGKPNWGGWHGTPPDFNVAHPKVQQTFLDEVRELAREGKSHPSFLGVALHLAKHNPLWFGTIECGYNDYCVASFEKTVLGRVGVPSPTAGRAGAGFPLAGVERKDPLRGKAYYETLTGDPALRERWIAWRCEVVADFYAKLAKALKDERGDLKLWVNVFIDWDPEEPGFGSDGYRERKLREAGIDPDLIAKKAPNVVLGFSGFPAAWRKWYHDRVRQYNLPSGICEKARDWSVSPRHFETIRSAAIPWAHFHDIYWENAVGARRVGGDILSNDWLDETPWRVSTIHPSGANALAAFAAALAGCDAQVLSCGGFLIGTLGYEPELAAFMREYRRLPAAKFRDEPSPPGFVVRSAVVDGVRWRYCLRTEYPYTLEVETENP